MNTSTLKDHELIFSDRDYDKIDRLVASEVAKFLESQSGQKSSLLSMGLARVLLASPDKDFNLQAFVNMAARGAKDKFEEIKLVGSSDPFDMACWFFLDKAKRSNNKKLFEAAAKLLEDLLTKGDSTRRAIEQAEGELRESVAKQQSLGH